MSITMSGFKAKHHALQLLQRLAAGERAQPKAQRNLLPQRPGIKTSEDILKGKYAELAELMAVQHMEEQTVSALKELYLTPRKRERKSKRKTKNGHHWNETEGAMQGKKKRGIRNETEKSARQQRPQSASSTSSYSSTGTSRSTSSRSSARSKSSSSSQKRKERTFITIIEEEEEEEVISQDEIEERQLAKFDTGLARENEEEARSKRDAAKHTRRVSFVLEAEEEEHDDGDEHEMEDHLNEFDEQYSDHNYTQGPSPTYIEVGYDLLRDILRSPRSPRRKMKSSPGDEARSPNRDWSRDKSPRRRNKIRKSGKGDRFIRSPRMAWETFDSIPIPPRPKKDIKPSDHKLSTSDNPEIRRWLKHKNALIRRQKKVELKKEWEDRLAADSSVQKKMERLVEAEQSFDSWMKQKRKVSLSQRRTEKRVAIEAQKKEESERLKRKEFTRQNKNVSISAFGDKVPTPHEETHRKRKCTAKKNVDNLESGKGSHHSTNSEFNSSDRNRSVSEKEKHTSAGGRYPSSNPFKGLSYDEWMRQKLVQEECKKKHEKRQQKSDTDLEQIIPNLAKERIERAKSGKGKRVERDELPECDQPSQSKDSKPKPYTWLSDKMGPHPSTTHPGSRRGQYSSVKNTVPHPPSGKNRPRSGRQQKMSARLSSSDKSRQTHVFSPLFARPDPQGSESNDDHSEHSVKIRASGSNSEIKGGDTHNNSNHKPSKMVESQSSDLIVDPDQLNVFMTEFAD